MARVSDPEVGRDEDSVELSLGLSLGGSSFRKRPVWLSTSEIGSVEVKVDSRSFVGSTVDASPIVGAKGEDFLDPKSKREMHALRRQEARKKMEEKQMKKRSCNGNGFGNGIPVSNVVAARNGAVDDRTLLEAQEMQSRLRDRAAKEAEACRMQRNCRKNGELCRSDGADQSPNANPNPSSGVYASTPFQVVPMQMQYPLPPVQLMPFANGNRYPYVMPCWATAASSSTPSVAAAFGGDGLKQEKNAAHPVACQSFRPFHAVNRDINQNVKQIPCCESDQNDGSMGSSSSAVSDNRSASLQGGSSAETRSHSSRSPLEQTQTHVSPIHNSQGLVEHRASTHHAGSSQYAEITTDKPVLSTAELSPRNPQEIMPVNESCSASKSPTPNSPLPNTHKVVEEEDKKPKLPSISRMPCVSTTGNGPNGKTITGFLYRYTKTEVSIICVCHGSSFSPEEFVKHAGGTDVSHPLRHIVVAPTTFG